MRTWIPFFSTVLISLVSVVALGIGSASATPILASGADFDGSEVLIDFESLTDQELLTTQFAGVTFSGGLFGDENDAPPWMGTGTTATNFSDGSSIFDVIDVSFTSPVERFRFNAITNDTDEVDVEVFSVGGGSTVFNFDTGLTPTSVAFLDLVGISAIQIRVMGPGNHAFALDNLEYAAVPEPGTAMLMGLGLSLLARRRSNEHG